MAEKKKGTPVCVGIDMGTASLAVFARRGEEIIFSESVLLKHDTASLAIRREHRRMVRTRLAHRAREYWWNECAKTAGLPVLKTVVREGHDRYKIRDVDDRLKREHPAPNDDTVYAGSLLRIMILEGRIEELADWQVYKAIHSAMQQRGYDTDIPWKRGSHVSSEAVEEGGEDDQDDQENTESLSKFLEVVNQELPNESHHFACYFEAQRSGLWNARGGIVNLRQTHQANQHAATDFKGYVAPREWKERELKRLLQEVAKRYRKLNPDYVLYGPALVPYGSHPAQKAKVKKAGGDLSLKLGKETDWQGLLSQKLPRFDNRAVNRCVLFPTMAVCRLPAKGRDLPKNDESDPREYRLFPSFNMLAKLKNLRVIPVGKTAPEPLSQAQIQAAVEHFSETLEATKTQLKTFLKSQKLTLAPGHDTDLKYKRGGRGAYSRPALRVLSRWLFEGWTRDQAKEHIAADFVKGNQDPTKGLTKDDFKWIDLLPEDGYATSFYVPHTAEAVQQTPEQILGKIRHPVVKHRLELFGKVLEKLQFRLAELDIPIEHVRFGVEVIRDESERNSFVGAKARAEIQKRNNERAKQNEAIREQAAEQNLPFGSHEALKLMNRQGGIDPYAMKDGQAHTISVVDIARGLYEVDHIVPRSQGGSDGLHNKVLTLGSLNRDEKGSQTPYEWLHKNPEAWSSYVAAVTKMAKAKNGISKLTAQLLTAPNAVELDGKRSDLQATGYMERTAQQFIYSFFGLVPPQLGGARHVVFVPGAMTARYRKKYRLDSLLYDTQLRDEHNQVDREKVNKLKKSLKNRDNPCHHILDAAVVSFIPEWAKDRKKDLQFAFPKFAVPSWFKERVLQDHVPRWYNSEKPKIFATNNRLLKRGGKTFIAARSHMSTWTVKAVKKQLADHFFHAAPAENQSGPASESKATPIATALGEWCNGTKDKKMPTFLPVTNARNKTVIKRLRSYSEYQATHHLRLENRNILNSARHRGVIVWLDASKKRKIWNCHVVAAWSTLDQAQKALVAANPNATIETWNGGAMLEKGQTVELLAPVNDALPAGRYVIAMARDDGAIRFHGQDKLVIITKLIEVGQMRVVEP